MLEKIDLTRELGKKEYKRRLPELQNHLYAVQKASWDAKIPVIILFEGWDASGKGTSIQTLTSRLDPRGFKLSPIRAARTSEKKQPWLWRFWLRIPGRGEWAIFDRSWYGRVLVERIEKLIPESDWRIAYRDIVDFERCLSDDGYLIIKFFVHISREEQRRRFEKLTKDPLNAWHVTPEDWEHHRHYDEWLLAFEEMMERTETEWGPWTIVEGTDRQFTIIKIYETIIVALEERLKTLHASPDPALWKINDSEESHETEQKSEADNPTKAEVEVTEKSKKKPKKDKKKIQPADPDDSGTSVPTENETMIMASMELAQQTLAGQEGPDLVAEKSEIEEPKE
jgi:polyphosphate kinase 2 (PPK2 family)